jgi:hypothetical protein
MDMGGESACFSIPGLARWVIPLFGASADRGRWNRRVTRMWMHPYVAAGDEPLGVLEGPDWMSGRWRLAKTLNMHRRALVWAGFATQLDGRPTPGEVSFQPLMSRAGLPPHAPDGF